ncbi:MAG TPA: S41 family peptidase [Streptosporangiaceae bacterium]|nr:S41 family peptidase [Streptosporangiaceae bacterium]
MTVSRYLRYPHLRGDLLTFIADNDVWLAPADGGRAWRISADQAAAAYPRLSPDGSMIAWTSWRDGPAEIYLAATGEGGSERVTYWSAMTTVMRGWGPDGEILATTSAGQPFARQTWAYAIPVTDGTAQFAAHRRLPFGPVGDIVMEAGTTALLNGTGGEEPAFWKRYRGGRGGRIWVASEGGGFRRLLADLHGQFFSLMLVGDRLAFICDHEGTANLYSCALDGSDLRRHTDHDGPYARNASTDGTRVVYQLTGELWMLPDLGPASEPVKLDISLGSPASGLAPRLVSADDHLADLKCDVTGRASVVAVRGTVHWLTHRDGPARALSAIPGPPARLPVVLGSTGKAAWVVDADGADAIEIGAHGGQGAEGANGAAPRRIARGEIGWAASIEAAPNGALIAVAAHDGGLTVVDVESGQVTELARSDNGRITGLAFSPDSRWLAWSQPDYATLRKLRLARLADGEVADVTDGRFIDTDPVFTFDGLYLGFLSKRTFDPIHDSHVFDLYFPYGSRPYLITLAPSTPSPFGPFSDGRPIGSGKDDDQVKSRSAGAGSSEAGPAGAGSAGAGPAGAGSGGPESTGAGSVTDDEPGEVLIDLAGLGDRIVALPVPDSRYQSLRAVDGGLAWLREPLTGDLGEGGASLDDDRPRPALEHFDIKRVKCTELIDEVNWFEASGDGTRLVVREHHRLFVVPADRKADADNADDRVSVDLSRARFRADPAALWRAAYAEAGRSMRHEYWVPDMADVDWDGVLDQYRPLLDRIASADDFADLLHEVVGELGSSHAYIRAAGASRYDGHLIGQLGADVEPGADGWQIKRILPAESSDPRARSPLAAPGAGLVAGDVITAVDGQPVSQATGPGPLLAGTAGKPVELTVRRLQDGSSHRTVVVPLADDRRLRYQDWVAGRRQLVRELGGGRLGYLHVPDMQSEGWSDFHRDLRAELKYEGLIIDVRANRGGHTSQLVVEKIARKIIGWDVARNAQAVSYPEEAPRGPVVAVADEQSASDGDIVTNAIRTLGIGPVVGTRTWGGVIGIDGWHELVDGTSMTFPKYSFWSARFGWGVENYGVDPDLEVVVTPEDWGAGHDVQLETAVRLALEALATQAASQPPGAEDRPSRRRPPLPPRPGAAG